MKPKGVDTMPKTEYLIEPGKQEITSTTVLDAPRELVFRAYTEPKLLAQWWGPRRYAIVIDKFDARPGGEWRAIPPPEDGGGEWGPGGPPPTTPPPPPRATIPDGGGAGPLPPPIP